MGDDSKDALEAWEAVVSGSWSVIASFDTGRRRYLVARANPPHLQGTRGLTEQERRVAGYAALGEANKLIAARLGISPSRVSAVLSAALPKLSLRSRAQLVYCVRGLGLPVADTGHAADSESPRKAA